jgi:hypothetical protein
VSNQETNAPNPVDRPEVEIDLEKLKAICKVAPTFEEIAAALDCSSKTIQRRYASDEAVREIIDDGRSRFRATQRRAFAAAVNRVADGSVERGDSSLVIFLAKQRQDVGGLGFSDKHEHDVRQQHSWADLMTEEAGGVTPAGGEPQGEGGSDGESGGV